VNKNEKEGIAFLSSFSSFSTSYKIKVIKNEKEGPKKC